MPAQDRPLLHLVRSQVGPLPPADLRNLAFRFTSPSGAPPALLSATLTVACPSRSSSNYNTAYFEIPSIRVYSNADLAANSSASATATNTATSASASGSSAVKSAAGRTRAGSSLEAVVAGAAVLIGGWALL